MAPNVKERPGDGKQPGCVRQFFEGELHAEFRAEDEEEEDKGASSSAGASGAQPAAGGNTTTTHPPNARPKQDLLGSALAPFLPKGFPDSVTPDYASFQLWDTSQALCSYVRGMLCHKAMLTGIGVGKEAATPLGALFHFFMRDFIGMLGGIVFAYWQGSGLDSHAKQWRLFADCINNIGLALELASPLFPEQFLLMACLGSIARALCGVAAGATRAAMTQHFAVARNAADIAAKEGSQETATTLIGMIAGMAVTHFVADVPWAAWATFSVLTALHVYFNIRAVRSLCLRSLNQPRVEALVAHFVSGGGKDEVLPPERLNAAEPLAVPPLRRLLRRLGGLPVADVSLGTPVADLVQRNGVAPLLVPPTASSKGSGAAAVSHGSSSSPPLDLLHLLCPQTDATGSCVIGAVLHRRANERDVLTAYVHAAAAMHLANNRSRAPAAGGKASKGVRGSSRGEAVVEAALRESDDWMKSGAARSFLRGLEGAGWDLTRISLPAGPWRAEWPMAYHCYSAHGGDASGDGGGRRHME